ncbi:UNVERIFIED_CONTAM: hypothetical protein B566_EDAN018999 [Ephemera danica]|nr:hypothetical protein B566_EDAN018999 [Ephemera danica]
MRHKIRKAIASCDLCQKCKVGNSHGEGEMNPIIPEGPGKLVALDLYGPLPQGRAAAHIITATGARGAKPPLSQAQRLELAREQLHKRAAARKERHDFRHKGPIPLQKC